MINTTTLIRPALVLMVAVVFGQMWHHEFTNFDDQLYSSTNPRIARGITVDNVIWAFSTEPCAPTANWIPLTWLSLMFDASIYGEWAGGFKLTNLVLHAANVLLLFGALQRMTGATWRSACVAGLFAVHPMHVETVAWISERKGLVSTFFGLISLSAYVCYCRRFGLKWYLAAIAAFICSLMSKQMFVTLPCLLLLLDYWPLKRFGWGTAGESSAAPVTAADANSPLVDGVASFPAASWRRLIYEKLPFFALAAGFAVVAVFAQRQGGAIQSLERFPLAVRSLNVGIAYEFYLGKLVWPVKMTAYYPHPGELLSRVWGIAAVAVLIGLTAVAYVQRRRHPNLVVGWFWFLGTLVPVIGLVQIGTQQMADRYTYVPYIGLYIAVCWFVPSISTARVWRQFVLPGLAGLALTGLMIVSWVQVGYWSNSIALYEHALEVTPQSDSALVGLGDALSDQGRGEEAITLFRRAVAINPRNPSAHYNLGWQYGNQGRFGEAVFHFRKSLELEPSSLDARNNLGVALRALGRPEEAIPHFNRVLKQIPDYATTRYNLGLALGDVGRMDEAIAQLQTSLSLNPTSILARHTLAEMHTRAGEQRIDSSEYSVAISHFRQALELKPGDPRAWYGLASTLSLQGEWQLSEQQFTQLLRHWPDFAKAHYQLGLHLRRRGMRELSIEHFQQAIRLQPDFSEAERELRKALRRE